MVIDGLLGPGHMYRLHQIDESVHVDIRLDTAPTKEGLEYLYDAALFYARHTFSICASSSTPELDRAYSRLASLPNVSVNIKKG